MPVVVDTGMMKGRLFSETTGARDPTLVLLHGLGVNGAVWQPFLKELDWPGRIVMPDLRGHGRSAHTRNYSFAHHAVDIADLFNPDEVVHVVGHSMGGAVGLVLASGMFGISVARLTAFGIKPSFSAEELSKIAKLAEAPVRWFETRAAAAERFLLVAGLTGLTDAQSPVVQAGLCEEGGRWRLAADNAAGRVAGPPLSDMVAMCRAPLRLGRGDRDPMVTLPELLAFDAQAVEFAGCGHSPHVEAPGAVAALVRKLHLP